MGAVKWKAMGVSFFPRIEMQSIHRAHAEACSIVLKTAWTFEWGSTSPAPPFDLDAVLKDAGKDS